MNKFFLVFLLLLPPSLARAHQPEEGKIHAILGPYVYRTNTSHDGINDPWLGGVGLIAQGDVDNHGGLELAMFYVHKLYVREENSKILAQKAKRIYVTMGYRHWFNPSFSLAAAFFSAYSMGDPTIVHSDYGRFPPIDTSAGEKAEYGFDFSAQWEMFSLGDWAAVMDTRYSWSVTPKINEDADHYALLIGLKYKIQEK